MKATINLPRAPGEQGRALADRDGIPVGALIERGLRQVLPRRPIPPAPPLRKASFAGHGLQPEVEGIGRDRLRDLVYEGRGC
jgi:hypothetical protein